MLAAILICGATTMLTSCCKNDNPADDNITPKVFRLAQTHASVDSGEEDWYSFLYDDQGRVVSNVGIVALDPGKNVATGYTYSYEDNTIVALGIASSTGYVYVLNDKGLIAEVKQGTLENAEEFKLLYKYEYDSKGRMIAVGNGDMIHTMLTWNDDDDLVSTEVGDQSVTVNKTSFTWSDQRVEQGYFLPLLESLDESLYRMGHYGVRPKHLLAQMTVTTKGDLLGKTMETNIVRKYDYTLENGLVTTMEMNSSSKMTIGDITTEKQNRKKYSFVWEEVK